MNEQELREQLEEKYGKDNVWNIEEFAQTFKALYFKAPFCVTERRSDGVTGVVTFTHMPRFYYDFKPI
jgi:hypothetical protein